MAMGPQEEDTVEIREQEELLDEPLPFMSREKTRGKAYICKEALEVLTLGLVAGLCAGACLGSTAVQMAGSLRDAMSSPVTLAMVSRNNPRFLSHLTCAGLLVAIVSSLAGVEAGCQVYHLVQKQKTERNGLPGASGTAGMLAALVAALALMLTGASLGRVWELSAPMFVPLSVEFGFVYVLCYVLAGLMVSFLIFKLKVNTFEHLVYTFYFLLGCFLCKMIALTLYRFTEYIIFLDVLSVAPLTLSLLIPFLGEFSAYDGYVNMPAIMTVTVLVTRCLLRDGDRPVPLMDRDALPASTLTVVERIFVMLLGLQMCEASTGAALFLHFVGGGEGKVCTFAVAASGAMLGAVVTASPALGPGASLGALLAASAAAGVALGAAGALDRGYGRAGWVAVLGAAVGAFLPAGLYDVGFGLQVSLCAAVIPVFSSALLQHGHVTPATNNNNNSFHCIKSWNHVLRTIPRIAFLK
ncbi:uncharacterized protein LOC143527502 [Brachyhypopomus gauderio]|uniref:uncharacterized protein LOC143527502 n=1 Tax=Brachyhypopomus gauderio TaxID=698409 RepID=UPI0040431214